LIPTSRFTPNFGSTRNNIRPKPRARTRPRPLAAARPAVPLCQMADGPPPAAAASTAAAATSDVVGFAYQPEMLEHRGPRNHHPEKPERLTAVLEVLQAGGLLDQCVQLPARSATDEELLRVHTAAHLKHVAAATQAVAESPDDRSLQEPHGVDAIYYHASTERASRIAAGCVLQATERVLCGECRTAFALVRPPGHHAEADEAIGFCFYNSVRLRLRVRVRVRLRLLLLLLGGATRS